jgi:hypothetical protein
VNGVLGIAMPKVILDQPQVVAAVGECLIANAVIHSNTFDLAALAARYDGPGFWNRALIEAPDDSLA